ncbi:MAG: hypothetical protein OEW39_05610 [Deltaproteobacteria bacterium]|nr:hypothetical protein [Deltaproteobacteria bacterium]
MALASFLKGSAPKDSPSPVPAAKKSASAGLASILQQGVGLPPERRKQLEEGLTKGLEFFNNFNESRLKLAFSCFDPEMKKAFYEVLFFCHVNDPAFANLNFTAIRLERVGGVVRQKEEPAVANLYMEGAPHGVEGIGHLSPVYREEFQKHIREVFQMEVSETSTFGYCPIKSLHSLGSIGTIGHKSRASDLDLQVQYELEPFLFNSSAWNDDTFRESLMGELSFQMNRLRIQQKLPANAFQDAKVRAQYQQAAMGTVAKTYPNLYRFLIAKDRDYTRELAGESAQQLRSQVLHEVIQLMKRSARVRLGEDMKKQETLLQLRLKKIQEYVADKYPMAEIYLFTCSNDDYRQGHHGSTLVSKEASGSAYELILNYETLMPGIQLTPMIPSHFVLPQNVNDDPVLYERIIEYIRFGLVNTYDSIKARLVNLGPTPDLGLDYMSKHSGAVYWEAFKASSGNLPKALLNLFRIEMLVDKRYLKTAIQIIKDPDFLNTLASPQPEDQGPELELMIKGDNGVPAWALVDMEQKFPSLKQDPWWLRYKALKIAFHEPKGMPGIPENERHMISKTIDTAFALHVRISDVFTKPGDTRSFDTFRDQVLIEFLKRAFPPVSERRKFLEMLFIGEIRSLRQFEQEMRVLFKNSLNRVNTRIAALAPAGQSNRKEFEIWYHYYQENFEPAANVIQRTILKHLMVPRGRLRVGYELKEGWFFISDQKESKVGKRFDTFGHLDHLPENVVLREKSTFISGLAECVLNGYYGVLNQGTLKETRTAIEFDAKKMDLGNRIDNTMAFLRPDNVHRLFNMVIEFFGKRAYHYMDCVNTKRSVVDLMIVLNAFKYGRLSFVYRDNLLTWYCDEFDHKELFQEAHNLHNNPRALLTAKPIHLTIAKFLKSKGINLGQVKLDVWVNPHSLAGFGQSANKEKELQVAFTQLIMQVHGPKDVDPSAPGTPAVAKPAAPGTPAADKPAASGTPAVAKPAAPGTPGADKPATPGAAPSQGQGA